MILKTKEMTPEQNFRAVLESAYDYGSDVNESCDYVGICLDQMDAQVEGFINEAIEHQSENEEMNESMNEATNVYDAKIVKEKRGSGISVMVNGKEYRYVSPTRSTEDLFRSFNGMLKHGKAGYVALNWLKKNALCYYGAKNASEEGQELVGGVNESATLDETTQPSDVPPSTADLEDDELKEPILEAVDGRQLIATDSTGMSYYDDFLNKKDHDYKKLVKHRQGEIVMMSPEEYLNRLGKDIFKCSRERVMRGVDWDNVKKYAEKMKNGTKFDLPVLNLIDKTQEGRHRALAAAELGAKEIPILVVTEYDPYKELDMPKSFDLFYGHTIMYKKKDGTSAQVHVGLDEEAMKAKIKEIVKSGDYK